MANSPTGGGPPGTRLAGPLWLDTDSTQTFGGSGAAGLQVSGLTMVGPFYLSNLLTNKVNSPFQTATAGAAAFTSFVTMPKGGSIVGMSINSNGTYSANAPTLIVRVNSTTKMTQAFGTSVTTKSRFTTNLSSYTFNRGDRMKVVYTSAAAMAPITRDVTIYLWTT